MKSAKPEHILRFFGVLKNKNWKKREKEHRQLRKEFEERLKQSI
ncbi:MAG: hypothetical protein Q7R76_00255 [Candidatus Woesearchaeota archaeon]|nr:hypothetical protein [Candidatus Woesearchaeota archaeon]